MSAASPPRTVRSAAPARALLLLLAALSAWLVYLIGTPTFWDPDEATYAQASREMLQAGQWLVPTFNGRPFMDKPPLFYILQILSYRVFGVGEFAARFVPAVSAVGLFALIRWFGRRTFGRLEGLSAALMFVTLPATFALAAYAILDMTFTLFLFGAVCLVTVSVIERRPTLEHLGYLLLACAVLVKGPVALALTGLAYLGVLVVAPELRPGFLRLHLIRGAVIVIAVAGPWFLYMWWRFGDTFVQGYVLNENIWLFTRPLYGSQPSRLFYVRVMATGLLPWTPLVLGGLFDGLRRRPLAVVDRVLWVWVVVIVGFFSVSSFRLDHYVFPACPALCLLAARAWHRAQQSDDQPVGARIGAACAPALLIIAGLVLVPGLRVVPLPLPTAVWLVPLCLVLGGVATWSRALQRRLFEGLPLAPALTLTVVYVVVLLAALPAFEQAKPTPRLARLVRDTAPADTQVAMYRLNRWTSSWRFYVDRHTVSLDSVEEVKAFFDAPGLRYCAMLGRDFDALRAAGLALRVVHEETGLFTTTGRALRAGARARRERFVVVTSAPMTLAENDSR